jgi:hypothetical protein
MSLHGMNKDGMNLSNVRAVSTGLELAAVPRSTTPQSRCLLEMASWPSPHLQAGFARFQPGEPPFSHCLLSAKKDVAVRPSESLHDFAWTHFDDTMALELGIGLIAFGAIFIFFGILFFFDKGLLAIGDVHFH